MAFFLKQYINKNVLVVTNDGETIKGNLNGVDNVTNLIITEIDINTNSQSKLAVKSSPLRIIKGDNLALLGEYVDGISEINGSNQ
eukprot:maker-scaffold_12-snap-gene-5.20-mRNA-1 protein AED:0.00 eAED:0.00 QI:89/1/1/1/0/0.5/2/156/84